MTSPSPNRLRPFHPTPFGRYTLLLPLSSGGMGELFIARLEGTRGFGKLCVVKRVRPALARDPGFLNRFVDEAKTLVQLQHGAIAQVLDVGMVDGEPYLALEYVDGKDLRRLLNRARELSTPPKLEVSVHLVMRVLEALAYVHRKRDEQDRELGLVHRDISPQNILVSYEGEVKVIDFGLAKSALNAAKTNPSIVMGKFLYMSPEQARQAQVDARSDLYSVGVVLFELVAGRNPFEDTPTPQLLPEVGRGALRPLRELKPDCPASLEAVLNKALAVEPSERFQTADAFRAQLLQCQVELGLTGGAEKAGQCMRQMFETEFQQERRLLSSLKSPSRSGQSQPPLRPVATLDEAVPGRDETIPGSLLEQPTQLAPVVAEPMETTAADSVPWASAEILPPASLEKTSPGEPEDTDPGGSGPHGRKTLDAPPRESQTDPDEWTGPVRAPRAVPRWAWFVGAALISFALVAGAVLFLRPPAPAPAVAVRIEPVEPESAMPDIPADALEPDDSFAAPDDEALEAEDDELTLAPLQAPAPSKPRPAAKPVRKTVPVAQLEREYERMRAAYDQVRRRYNCDVIKTLCQRYSNLTDSYYEAVARPDQGPGFLKAAEALRRDLEAKALKK